MSGNFCTHCGKPQESYNTGKFDEITGQPISDKHCVNEKCFWGCDNTGGHRWNWRWFLGSDACMKCGYSPMEMW